MRKLFGTDGIRGVAGRAPLDPATIYATGLALAHSLKRSFASPSILLGADTRESSLWISAVIDAGLRAGGAAVANAGIITTPAIAYLTHKRGFAAGIVISASHNPWQDNGIKVFGSDGYKLPDATELSIEDEIFRQLKVVVPPDPASLDAPAVDAGFRYEYEQFLRAAIPGIDLRGIKIIIDCANGAASAIAPELFASLGADARLTHITPDGRNINAECGALYPKVVAADTRAHGADVGVTFDGDADRALFADANGNVVNGDSVLLLAGLDMKKKQQLTGDLIVATTMSNMGLEAALRRNGIRMLRAPVGDKYVLEQMKVHRAALGGEQSGHILFPHLATTGDGLLTALVLLDLVKRSGLPLHELCADFVVFPQVIVNIKVREKRPLEEIATVADTIRAAEQELKENGRVVVRYSGTEALARVMIEAESEDAMKRHSEAIANAIRNELGV